jgi:Flp pilus assembly protein TadD
MSRLPACTVSAFILLVSFAAAEAAAQTPVSQAPVKRTCAVVNAVETDADRALRDRDFARAEALYRAQLAAATTDEARSAATAAVIRTQLAAGKLKDALDLANSGVAQHPQDAVLQDTLGEAHFRRGEMDEAATALETARALDFCNPRIHYDFARYLRLNGRYATEQQELDLAHRLSPHDATFSRAAAPRIQTTAEDRVARMTARLDSGDLSTEERASLQRAIDVARAQSKGSCQIVRPVESTKIPMVPIVSGPDRMYGVGLELQLNGRRKRFQIDTGASGLLISRSAAASAGILSEAEGLGGGIGDKGLAREFLAHVDSLRIGELEFQNCLVRVFDKRSVLDVDGLIGPDVFSSWLVTLDIPSREVRLSPLPKRPDDAGSHSPELDTAGGDENNQAIPQDRYIAPEMHDWTRVFRYNHDLIFITHLGKGPSKLFIMDTGASTTLVSPSAAKEVTGVSGSDAHVRGISGEVDKVSEANDLTIAFATVRQRLPGTLAIDTSNLGRGSGVEISGLIGFPTLRQLIITIDYRDNLVHVVYDPNHGFH